MYFPRNAYGLKPPSQPSKKLKHQGHLEQAVSEIFPGHNFETNVRKKANIVNPVSGQYLELDVWLPELKIAFEFQDVHHYVSWWRNQKPLDVIREADNFKKKTLDDRGETLIVVPCWWDGSTDSLIETIRLRRPELVSSFETKAKPISEEAPQDYFKVYAIPGVGELMNASFSTSTQLDIDNWWMGEKYDGIRACWNCKTKTMYTRKALPITVPDSIKSFFPSDIFLDGEIWFGRGSYNEASRVVLTSITLVPFHFFRVIAFDNPNGAVHDLEFESRYASLFPSLDPEVTIINIAPRLICKTKKQLVTFTKFVIDDGGEGTMLRKPKSVYEQGRTTNLLKFKASRADRESLVVAVDGDQVTLQLPDGIAFDTEITRDFHPDLFPTKGDIVSFSYQHFSKNDTPVDPQIYRIRTDLNWQDVVQNFLDHITQPNLVNEVTETLFSSNEDSPKALGQTKKPHAFWTAMKGKNSRAFFDRYAQKKQFDPLLAQNWYSVKSSDIKLEKHGRAVIERWGGSLVTALITLYPDIGLVRDQFDITTRNYWNSDDNKRKALTEYAKRKGFDPLVAENWYSVAANEMDEDEGPTYIVKKYFKGSLVKTLISLYPEISFDQAKFKFKRNHWPEVENRKRFFVAYARKSGFDPLIAENWYHVSSKEMTKISGGMLKYNNQSVGSALLEIFPNIGLDVTRFSTTLHKWYAAHHVRKSFCDGVAASLKFNPRNPENWYSVSYRDILLIKGGSSVLSYYDYKLSDLLLDVYPDIGLEKHLFMQKSTKVTPEYQRRFLEELATFRGLDPLAPDTWYGLSAKDILQRKGGAHVLNTYGSYLRMITTLFPDIGIQEEYLKAKWYSEPQAIRNFCDQLATSLGFDPLSASHWYSISLSDFLSFKGGSAVLKQFKYNTANLLMTVYPSIGLDSTQLKQKIDKSGPDYRRVFLSELAEEKHMDPLNPQTWYNLYSKDVSERKGGSNVMEPYGSYTKTIMAIFPDIGLIESNFKSMRGANQYGKSRDK